MAECDAKCVGGVIILAPFYFRTSGMLRPLNFFADCYGFPGVIRGSL